jgi:hypothetical protein
MKSVFQKRKECLKCGAIANIHEHHIFEGTSNRRMSEKYGFKIFLCAGHHNMSNEGIHFDKEFDLEMKEMAQSYFEENIGSRDLFREEFGKSWL